MKINNFVFLAICALLGLGCVKQTPTKSLDFAATDAQIQQQASAIFSLCLLSNVNSYMVAPPESLSAHVATAIPAILSNDTVQKLIGNWELKWGPVAFTDDMSAGDEAVTDNTMMLVKGSSLTHPGQPLWVLAVAGTNGYSNFDWVDEDFPVNTMVKWPGYNSSNTTTNFGAFAHRDSTGDPAVIGSGPYISTPTATGLDVLLNTMRDPLTGLLLVDYLQKNVGTSDSAAEFAVTGHSLGGTLAPCVAMALHDNQAYWNASKSFTITAYPFAGPSPGNAHFAQYFKDSLGAANFFGQYNTMDIAPMTYDSASLGRIASLYDPVSPDLDSQCVFAFLFGCFQSQTAGFQYTSLYSPQDSFRGTVAYNDSTYAKAYTAFMKKPSILFQSITSMIKCTPTTGNKTKEEAALYARSLSFAAVVFQQHFDAYIAEMDIAAFNAIYQRYLQRDQFSMNNLGLDLMQMDIFNNCF